MKVLIAIVMFLFGLFIGILIIPAFQEFSTPMSIEEEYSTPRIKTILSGCGITLPLEAADVNLYLRQDENKKQIWMKFECSDEVKEAFMQHLNSKHAGMFNREIETPKMFDGSAISWWTFRNTFRYYEFHGMCAAYDDVLHNLYVYVIEDDETSEE